MHLLLDVIVIERWIESFFFFFLRKKLRSLWHVIVEKLTRTIPFKNVKPCSTQTGSETPGIYFTLRGDYGV